jgi:hypothetical protein
MLDKTATLIRIDQINGGAVMALALVETRKYFAGFNLPQPPLPDDCIAYLPSVLLITETRGERGKRVGRIKFIRPDDEATYFDQEWEIAPERPRNRR